MTTTSEATPIRNPLPEGAQVTCRRWRHGRTPGEQGTLSVEMVILGAVIVVTLCLGVGAGTLVLADGRVSAAAASAARAASLESSPQAATTAARSAATRTLGDAGTTCTPTIGVDVDTSQFRAGGRVQVQVRCRVDLSLVAIAGFGAHRDLTATAAAPLEQHRSFQGRP